MAKVVSVAQEHNHDTIFGIDNYVVLTRVGFNNMAEKITNQPNYWVRLKLYREMLERQRGCGRTFKTLPKYVTDKRIMRQIELRYKRKEREEML